jgi:hypothetical protein
MAFSGGRIGGASPGELMIIAIPLQVACAGRSAIQTLEELVGEC